jgi:hypothetical protein
MPDKKKEDEPVKTPTEETPVTEKQRKYEDSSMVQSYTDPYTKKQFWPVVGSEENINRSDVFPFDVDPNGAVVYGTYTNPDKSDIKREDYVKTTFRKFQDNNESKIFFPGESTNMQKLYWGGNPYKDRTDLAKPSLLQSEYNVSPKNYTRTLDRVGREYDGSGKKKTDNGYVWVQKGNKYYKYYKDGSKEEVSKMEHDKWIGYNNAPEATKLKYGTENVPMDKLTPEQRKIAEAIQSSQVAASDDQEQ